MVWAPQANCGRGCGIGALFKSGQHPPAKLLAKALQGKQCSFAGARVTLVVNGCLQRAQDAVAIDGADAQALHHARQAQCSAPACPICTSSHLFLEQA